MDVPPGQGHGCLRCAALLLGRHSGGGIEAEVRRNRLTGRLKEEKFARRKH